jgi:hypothetical protein
MHIENGRSFFRSAADPASAWPFRPIVALGGLALTLVFSLVVIAGFGVLAEAEAQPQVPAASRTMPHAAEDAPAHVAAEVRMGRSAAMGSSSLAIGKVRFSYAGDQRHQPQLSFTVTNVGEHHIASFNIDARLYLNGAGEPVVGTDFGRTYNKPFFIHLGDRGLPPRSSREVSVAFGLDAYHWVRAEALHARSLAVAIRVVDVSDIHMRRLDERSPPFKEAAPVLGHL